MEYELVGKDLPKLYKDNQEPLLHYGESFELARGKGWVASVASRGEIRAYIKGERVCSHELPDYYQTDKALYEAEKKGELEVENNNWFEVEFYKVEIGKDGQEHYTYLDIVADDCVVYSFDEALHMFDDYINDKGFQEELKKAVREA